MRIGHSLRKNNVSRASRPRIRGQDARDTKEVSIGENEL